MTELVERAEFGTLADLEEAGAITSTGLRLLDETMSIDRWAAVGRMLGRTRTAISFAIGDWKNFGEQIYGEEAAQFVHCLGVSYDTATRYGYVCLRIPPSRRRDDLSFSHHAEVAPLDPEEQKRWLGRAAAEGLTAATLRQEIREKRIGVTPETSVVEADPDSEPSSFLASAARDVVRYAQRDGDGWRIPLEPFARLRAAVE